MTQTVQRPVRTSLVNNQEVRRTYTLLTTPGQVVEIRALEASREPNSRYLETLGGYFDNINDLLREISTIRQAMGIYITLHPCHPDIIHRAKNKLIRQKKDYSTPDKYITAYQWLAIDCDPDRISGISSNEEEHQRGLTMCRNVRQALRDRGWPEPILCDSGNGGHLLYRIDLPPSDADLVKRTLAGLEQFNEDRVHVDLTMFNPARIIKLYGTLASKGDNTEERPHRFSQILEIPDEIQVVSRSQLMAIAVPIEETPELHRPATNGPGSNGYYVREPFSLESFIQKHNIQVKSVDSYNGGKRYKLAVCPWDPSHTDNSACLYDMPHGLGASCSHHSCSGKHWRDFRILFEPDAYTRNLAPVPGPAPNKKKKRADTSADTSVDEAEHKPSTQELLMEIASQAHFINSPSGALFARVQVNGHHEIAAINEKGSGFRRWLVYQFNKRYDSIPNSDALSQTMSGIQAIAEYEGEKAKVHTRIAEKNGCVYLDLANEKWECIEISPDGWRKISCPPVYFRRPNGMLPLPVPQSGGDLAGLRKLINAKTDKDYVLITSWLVGALHPTGPYPVLNLNGERGSAKSKATTILRNLIDPNEAPTRNAPKDDRDAAVAAQNNMVIALDNLSSMPLWLSDVLCRIATGSGFATREMYSDDTERVFSSKRPIILNGIEDGLIAQGDLLNRAMLVTLEPPSVYRSEEEVDDLFREAHPCLLGALLTIASQALRDRKKVQLAKPPRMADFARWMTAAEPALKWKSGTFIDAYIENQDNASSIIVESSPVAKAIMQFMSNNHEKWEGLTKDLLIELQKYEVYAKAKTAPTTPNKLSGQLKRVAPSLRIQGIDIQQPPRKKDGSHVILEWVSDVDKGGPGVDKSGLGVDKSGLGVDKNGSGVDKNPGIYTHPSEQLATVDGKNDFSGVDGVDKIPYLSGVYPPLDSEKEEEKEVSKVRPDGEGNLSTSPTPSPSTAQLNGEIEDLYNGRIKPLLSRKRSDETLMWRAPGSSFEQGMVAPNEYGRRVEECRDSNDHTRMQAALEAMKRTLGIYEE